jgi:hypothetical protein
MFKRIILHIMKYISKSRLNKLISKQVVAPKNKKHIPYIENKTEYTNDDQDIIIPDDIINELISSISLDKYLLNTIDEETIDEETIDEETIDEETFDEETVDEETIDLVPKIPLVTVISDLLPSINDLNEKQTNILNQYQTNIKLNTSEAKDIDQNNTEEVKQQENNTEEEQQENNTEEEQQENNTEEVKQQENNTEEEQQENNTEEVKQQENNTEEVKQQENNTEEVKQQENNTEEEQQENNTEEVKQQENNTEEVKQQENNTEEEQQENNTEEVKQQENNTEEVKQQENNTEEVKQQENNTEEEQQENNTEEVKQQENNTEEVKQQENNTEEEQQENNTEEVKQQENNTEEVKQKENNTEEVKQKENNEPVKLIDTMIGIHAYFGSKHCSSYYKEKICLSEHRGYYTSTLNIGTSHLAVQSSDIYAFEKYNGVILMCDGWINMGYRQLIDIYITSGIEIILKTIRGEFAFVLYDMKKNKVYIARDHLGVRPLFFHYDNDSNLYLSSESKCVPTSIHIEPRMIYTYTFKDMKMDAYYRIPKIQDIKRDIILPLSLYLNKNTGLLDPSSEFAEGVRKLCKVDVYTKENAGFDPNKACNRIPEVIFHLETCDTFTILRATELYIICEYIKKNTNTRILISELGRDMSREQVERVHYHAGLMERVAAAFSLRLKFPFLNVQYIDAKCSQRRLSGTTWTCEWLSIVREYSKKYKVNVKHLQPRNPEDSFVRYYFEAYYPGQAVDLTPEWVF